jgi:hypothetical protein
MSAPVKPKKNSLPEEMRLLWIDDAVTTGIINPARFLVPYHAPEEPYIKKVPSRS